MKIEDREVNPDGTMSCGVFIPVPYNLARQFPDKSAHDDSVPHFTLLYAGNLTPIEFGQLVAITQKVAKLRKPFTADLTHYDEFVNNEGQTIAHMTPSWSPTHHMAAIHGLLRRICKEAGVPIAHTYGPDEDPKIPYEIQFKAHATLDYLDPGVAYNGPIPIGSWRVTDLEVWGYEKINVLLGDICANQPTGQVKEDLTESKLPPGALMALRKIDSGEWPGVLRGSPAYNKVTSLVRLGYLTGEQSKGMPGLVKLKLTEKGKQQLSEAITETRDSCLDCVRKHLAQALVLMSEARQGYPDHRWAAIGHMGEAADEAIKDYPKLAAEIRRHRLAYEKDEDYQVPIFQLIREASSQVKQEGAAWGRFHHGAAPLDVRYSPGGTWEASAAEFIRKKLPSNPGKVTTERGMLAGLADALERKDIKTAKRFYKKLPPRIQQTWVTVAAREKLSEDIEQIPKEKRDKLIAFVRNKPGLDDSEYHDYAEKLGIDPHEAEEVIYDYVHRTAKTEERAARSGAVAVSLLPGPPPWGRGLRRKALGGCPFKKALEKKEEGQEIPGGKARHSSPSDFDPRELAMGIEVEKEHLVGGGYSPEETKAKAREIAMDHLKEIPDYYTRLKKMEKSAGINDWLEREPLMIETEFDPKQTWHGGTGTNYDVGRVLGHIKKKKLAPRKVKVAHLQHHVLGRKDSPGPLTDPSFRKIAKRAHLKHPITVYHDDEGYPHVVDGGHRLAKAMMKGHKYIKAHVIKKMPKSAIAQPHEIHNDWLELDREALVAEGR